MLGSMEIVGSTRTGVFVTPTVGNDPDKVSLSFSGFPTKPNHQFSGFPTKLQKAPQAAGSLEVSDSVKSATGCWSTGGSMSAGGHSAKNDTGRRIPGGHSAKSATGRWSTAIHLRAQ